MNRAQFLKELRRALESLPFEEREAAITYYEEYFDEAGPEREQETIASLGTPAEIAASLRVEYATKAPPKTVKEGGTKAWMIIVAIFAFPVAIPLMIGLGGAMLGLFGAFFAVVVSLGAATVALFFAGIVTIIGSFGVLVASPVSFLFFLGLGLAALGLSVFLGFAVSRIAVALVGLFTRLLGWVLNKMKARRTAS